MYYEPLTKDYKPNNHWTIHVPADIMRDLRVHLTWTFGADVSHWTDEQIGKKIVSYYHKSNVLPLLLIREINTRKSKRVNYDCKKSSRILDGK